MNGLVLKIILLNAVLGIQLAEEILPNSARLPLG
jgi:hypothetical protein